ncbi:F-box only protein 31 isoform X1 [Rhipicephalus sanguineus]|uniref:F-box only protein 31 isoform X1 n=1 Tax=Rhipicephalus sanguineus TaxID=34632 RepID=UPI001894B157|nr:F-box only protein 31 isoform X1 [Rhipicephalus sanguineus]
MESFPPELLAKIFSFLNGKDIASVAQVCRSFYEASLIENVWRTRCALEFAVKVRHVGNFVFKDIYTKLLHKYRFYLGLWQPQVSSYGGLFQVLFDPGHAAIVGQELLPPRDPFITEPLRKKLLFTVSLDRENEDDVVCVGGYKGPHKAVILEISKDEFVFKCCDSNHHRHPNGKHQELRDWIHEETSVPLDMHQFPHSQELLLMKFLILRQLDYAFQYKRVTLQAPLTGVPIQPGIFKGTYGTHGLELIQLEYVDNCTKLRASKLSGDPNVPSGQVTFEVVLQYSMVLTAQQQASISALDAIEVRASDTPYNNVPTTPQPFRVPLGCHERFLEIPRTCIARYHGLGQVAGHGYTNPSFSRGHWVVFSEDLFGFLWLELLSLSMYHRVKEDLA